MTRLRLFTLSFGEESQDARQALLTAENVGLADFHEIIPGEPAHLDAVSVIRVIEDYQPLDVQCAAMNLALLDGIRGRYPDWRLILDGDGGDENLKDYPLEGTEITTHSVLNNLMLYHEGWGVGSVKHSLTYSGGLSRSYTRTYMTARRYGFEGFSPFTCCSVIEASEGIPFVTMTDYDAHRLYDLKGKIVAAGVKQVAGVDMPVPHKRRFQEGALSSPVLEERLPLDKPHYRRIFDSIWERPARGRTPVPSA
jgi:asparagine synthase (glutamine-hydrolysing)